MSGSPLLPRRALFSNVAPDMTPGGRNLLTVFPSIMLPMFLAVVDQTIVATALPAIAAELGNIEHVSWVVVSYLVATTIAAPVYGQLRDVFGSKPMMFIALGVFIGASAFCAVSTSIPMLTLGRILQGLGGGGLMTLSQAMIGEAIPPRERARYQGYLAAIMVTSSAFGPVAGGYLTEHFGWRSVFLVNLPVGILALLLTFRLERRPASDQPWRFDTAGLLLLVAFIVPVLVALSQLQRIRSGMIPGVVAAVVFGLIALVLLIRREKRAPFPLLPIALLRDPTIWRSDALAACHGATLVSLVTFLPIYLHVIQGATAAAAGILLLPLMFGIGFGSMLTGRIMSRTGYTMIFPSVGLIFATATLIALAFWISYLSPAQLAWLLFLNGLFMGTVMGVVQVTVQTASMPNSLGAGAASVQLSRSLGAAAGTALVGTVLFATLSLADPEAARIFSSLIEQGRGVVPSLPPARQAVLQAEIALAFRMTFLTIAGFALCGLALAWTIPTRRL
jgi:EmrB/QacA subfamily drug resistance transporter